MPLSSDSAQLRWRALDSLSDDAVDGYAIASKLLAGGDWQQSGTVLSAASQQPLLEVQRVSSRADGGATISGGSFRLRFASPVAQGFDPSVPTITAPLAWDASSDDVVAALQALPHVNDVDVTRSDADGGTGWFHWDVTFRDVLPADQGDVWTLTVYSDDFPAPWTAAGGNIAVSTLRNGFILGDVCRSSCEVALTGLQQRQHYIFRLRAHSAQHGWSEWGPPSQVVTMPSSLPPAMPAPPRLSSATQSSITLLWDAADGRQSTVTAYQLQCAAAEQGAASDLLWRTLPETVTQLSHAAGGLAADSTYVFRIRARNAVGYSGWSLASLPMRTAEGLPLAPVTPRATAVTSNSIQLVWDYDGQLDKLSAFQLQLRSNAAPAWQDVDDKLQPSSLRYLVSQLDASVSYQFRVRAISSVGEGPFSEASLLYRTRDAVIVLDDDQQLPASTGEGFIVASSADGRAAPGSDDGDYFAGVAAGGLPQSDGGPGMVAVLGYIHADDAPLRSFFFHTGRTENMTLPDVDFVTVKAWGGGGGGGNKGDSANGGAGAFVLAAIAVKRGDVLSIEVASGGGGSTSEDGGHAGFGGQPGSGGSGEFGGGGGGGSTRLWLNGRLLVVAGGGGGAGSSDFCCAAGGAAGLLGAAGGSPLTPLAPVLGEEHDDLGFTPAANLDVLATGGEGGSQTEGGRPGVQGSFVWGRQGDLLPSAAAGGHIQDSRGGNGGSGKEGGGGGGAGRFGGGGGGAGIDGGGGGAGSSWVDQDALLSTAEASGGDGTTVSLAIAPAAPELTTLRSTIASVSWQLLGAEPLEFLLELSQGVASRDFRVIARVPPSQRSFDIRGLAPSTTYGVRLRLSSLLGTGTPGDELRFTTPSLTQPEWSIVPQARMATADTEDARLTARRGASLVQLRGQLYLWGGLSAGTPCERGTTEPCRRGVGVVDELWRMHPRGLAWQLLLPDGAPPARERHSAVLHDNRMVIFGGNDGQAGDSMILYSDVWAMSTGSERSTSWQWQEDLPIPELELVVAERSVDGESDGSGDMTAFPQCVVDVQVGVELLHSCTRQLTIKLVGPAGRNVQDGTEALLFFHEAGELSDCGADLVGTVFNSSLLHAPVATAPQPFTATLQPPDDLSIFYGLPASGTWALHIVDGTADKTEGTLLSWSLRLTTLPCEDGSQPSQSWEELAIAGFTPPPRTAHSAAVVGDDMFIWGGLGPALLNDGWRLNLPSLTWTPLQPVGGAQSPFARGRTLLPTPWKTVALAGTYSDARLTDTVWQYDSALQQWSQLMTQADANGSGDLPPSRAWASVVLIGLDELPVAPRLLLFGGERDGELLNDLWQLDLEQLLLLGDEAARDGDCTWLFSPGAALSHWQQTCAGSAGASCDIADILLRSWCEGRYEAVQNW
eukprot:PLAT5256.1.p1 GENE.PLAT5256.1~~PLAT5256.1.p1  ORF type:complete len:1426 (+),score=625.87 PLAT5256.1:99-4280(+)